MTKELIIENCQRICQFYKSQYLGMDNIKTVTAKELLRQYGAILDWNGAPARNLSVIYLPEKEYEEFRREVDELNIEAFHKNGVYFETGCVFIYDGYYWVIHNEDAEKRHREMSLKERNK